MMAARQGADYWRGHVEGWRQSGLSQMAYCARHALNIKSFRRWRCKQQATSAAIRYADSGDLPIDNNPVENAIRPIAIGKNYPRSIISPHLTTRPNTPYKSVHYD